MEQDLGHPSPLPSCALIFFFSCKNSEPSLAACTAHLLPHYNPYGS